MASRTMKMTSQIGNDVTSQIGNMGSGKNFLHLD